MEKTKKVRLILSSVLLVGLVGCDKKPADAPEKPVKIHPVPSDGKTVPDRITTVDGIPKPVLVMDPQSFMKRAPDKSGGVTVEYIVEPSGRVESARISKSDMGDDVNDAVLKSVSESIYEKRENRVLMNREILFSKPIRQPAKTSRPAGNSE